MAHNGGQRAESHGRKKTPALWDDLLDYLLALLERPAFRELQPLLQEESERDPHRGRRSAPPQREVDVRREREGHDNTTLAKHARRRRPLEAVLPPNARSLGKRLAETELDCLPSVLVGDTLIEDHLAFRAPTDLERFWRMADSKLRGERLGHGTDQRWFSRQLVGMNPVRVLAAYVPAPDLLLDLGATVNYHATMAAQGSQVAVASQVGCPALGPVIDFDGERYLVEPWAPPGERRGRKPLGDGETFSAYIHPDRL